MATALPESDVFYPDVLIFCAKHEELCDALATIEEIVKGSASSSAPCDSAGPLDADDVAVVFDRKRNRVNVGKDAVVYFGDFVVRRDQAVAPYMTRSGEFSDAPAPPSMRSCISLRWVICSGVNQGPESGAAGIAALLGRLQPRSVLMLGMCAGRDGKLSLGDVACAGAATHIYEGKLKDGGVFLKDGRRKDNQNATKVARSAEKVSQELSSRLKPQGRRVQYVEFASGPMVDESGSVWKECLSRHFNAYDMEASAFFTATEMYEQLFDVSLDVLGVYKGVMDYGTAASRNGVENVSTAGAEDPVLCEYFGHAASPPKEKLAELAVCNATQVVFFGAIRHHAVERFDVHHVGLGQQIADAAAAQEVPKRIEAALKKKLKGLVQTAEGRFAFGPVMLSSSDTTAAFTVRAAHEVVEKAALTNEQKAELKASLSARAEQKLVTGRTLKVTVPRSLALGTVSRVTMADKASSPTQQSNLTS